MIPHVVFHGHRRSRPPLPLRHDPPREVPALRVWGAVLERTAFLPMALLLLFAVLPLILGMAEERAIPSGAALALAVLAALGALTLLLLAAREVARVRARLEEGRAARVRITRLRLSPWGRSNGRVRTRLEYVGTILHQEVDGRVRLGLDPRAAAPSEGGELTLLHDPSDATVHIVPLAYGFTIEPADGARDAR